MKPQGILSEGLSYSIDQKNLSIRKKSKIHKIKLSSITMATYWRGTSRFLHTIVIEHGGKKTEIDFRHIEVDKSDAFFHELVDILGKERTKKKTVRWGKTKGDVLLRIIFLAVLSLVIVTIAVMLFSFHP